MFDILAPIDVESILQEPPPSFSEFERLVDKAGDVVTIKRLEDEIAELTEEVAALTDKLEEAEAYVASIDVEPASTVGDNADDVNGGNSGEEAMSDVRGDERGNRVDSGNGDVSGDSVDTIPVEATFYTAKCDGCSGITYSGLDVRGTIYTPEGLRVIAVDPTVLPLGSIVRVTLGDGTTFKAEASDIGADIKGRRIDVLVATKDEAYRLGRQGAEVEIIR